MTDNLLNKLSEEGIRKPYSISKKKPLYPGNIVITLDGLELVDVPYSIAQNLVNLLNGAYTEGVISGGQITDSFYQIKL